MKYWFDTVDTIPAGVGFPHFGPAHLTWLAAIAVFIAASSLLYRRLSGESRKRMRILYAALIVADELFKMVMLTIGHRYLPQYLPFHLCSINIFVIAFHVFRPSKALANFLYTVCIPAAVAAMAGYIKTNFGVNYLKTRTFKTKSAGAQEAHEAIRPTNITVTSAGKNNYEKRLYQLIWARTLATQMANAKVAKTTIHIKANRSAGPAAASSPILAGARLGVPQAPSPVRVTIYFLPRYS